MNKMLVAILQLSLLAETFGVSPDCVDVVNLAIGMNLNTRRPSTFSQLTSDCCNFASTGVKCVSNTVTEIIWSDFTLNGYFDGSSIPSGVLKIRLDGNSLVGSFPTLPNGIQYIDFSGNKLTGDITGMLPSSLTTVSIENMQLSGTVSLNQPNYLTMDGNWITGLVILSDSLLYTGYCDISRNPLLGSPNISGLPCIKDGLYSANLLPNTRTTTKTTIKTTTTLTFPKLTTTSTAKQTTTKSTTVPLSTTTSAAITTTTAPIKASTAIASSKSASKSTTTSAINTVPVTVQFSSYFLNEVQFSYELDSFSTEMNFTASASSILY